MAENQKEFDSCRLGDCLAKGTLIRMADGSDKAIENVNVGDQVLAHQNGRTAIVQSTRVGAERGNMYNIETSNNSSIVATAEHPIVTTSGVKLAQKLKVGDQIITDQGPASVTSSSQQPAQGVVYNLDLQPTPTEESTFFANGILVGDNAMQRKYNRSVHLGASLIQQQLPQEWHTDYLSTLKT